jgi:hypothetical protein
MSEETTPRYVIDPFAIEESPHAFERRAEKAKVRLEKFQIDLLVHNELSLDNGENIEGIDQETLELMEAFKIATLVRQQEMAHKLRKHINLRLTGRLNASLALTHQLQTENSVNSNTIGKDEQVWRELFHNSTSRDRLEIVRSLEKMDEDMLIQNYGKYLEAWKEILANDPTISQETARQELTNTRRRFEHASRRGKVGLSKHLRKTLEASSVGKFSALLELYEKLLNQNRHRMKGDTLPTAEAWVEIYKKSSIAGRKNITDQLHNRVSLLITAAPAGDESNPKT